MGRRARGNHRTSQPGVEGVEGVVKVFVSLPEEDGGRDPGVPERRQVCVKACGTDS
jgi:hypothetical protein